MNTLVFLYVLSSVYTTDVKPMPDYNTCKAAMAVLKKAATENTMTSGIERAECYTVKDDMTVLNSREVEEERRNAELDWVASETKTESSRRIEVKDPSKSVKLQQFLKDQENAHE